MKSLLNRIAVAAVMAMTATVAHADEFPERTIEVIFPWGPGVTMSMSQLMAKEMSDELGVAVTVISTPGAVGTKAFKTAMSKPADGYTIIDGYVAPLVLQPLLGNADWTYEDFIPLESGFSNAFAIGLRSGDDRWSSFQELMAYCKANRGDLRYTTGFRNTLPHMVVAKVLEEYDCVAQNIPYKEFGMAMADLKSGVLDFGFVSVGEYKQESEAYNILLVLSELPGAKAAFGGAPAITELGIDLGLEGLAPMGWTWWVVHKDTPPERVEVLRKAMAAAKEQSELLDGASKAGYVTLQWANDEYDAVVGPVAGQLSTMRNSLAWEEQELEKLN